MIALEIIVSIAAMYSSPRVRPQSTYFYEKDGKFTPISEGVFINTLADHANSTGFPIDIESESLELARLKLNKMVNCFSHYDMIHRYSLLKERYQQFSSIIELPDVQYDLTNNKVIADRSIWRTICRVLEKFCYFTV